MKLAVPLRSYYTLLRMLSTFAVGAAMKDMADVATRPWRTPRFACRPSWAIGAPGSMGKINVVRFPQDGEIIQHSPFRRQIAKLKNQSAAK